MNASSERTSADQPRRSELQSKVAIGAGVVLSLFGTLNVISAARDIARVVRFGIRSYIGSYNLGTGVFHAVLSAVFLALGWLLLRKRLSRELVLRALIIALAVTLVLGIGAEPSE